MNTSNLAADDFVRLANGKLATRRVVGPPKQDTGEILTSQKERIRLSDPLSFWDRLSVFAQQVWAVVEMTRNRVRAFIR